MNREPVKAVPILPGAALVYVPGAIVWLTAPLPGGWAPVPWAPPRKLVLRGPYRHVRNPMPAAEALLLGS